MEEQRKKLRFPTELAYILSIITLALGTALMERSDFGISMVVAPAYLLYLKLSSVWSFVTFGMMEYTFQALLLAVMMLILKRFRVYYLFSFVTAVLYGFTLDGFMALIRLFDVSGIPLRLIFYVFGALFCTLGVALAFRTYFPAESYELIVKELSAHFKIDIHRFKTFYDCTSCLVGVILSFAFFGMWHFEGVKIGTLICALVNGQIIRVWSGLIDKNLELYDRLPFRRFFE